MVDKSNILLNNAVEKAIEEFNNTMRLEVKSDTLDAFFYSGNKRAIFMLAGVVSVAILSKPVLKFLLRSKTNKTYSITETYIEPIIKDIIIIIFYLLLLFSPILLLK